MIKFDVVKIEKRIEKVDEKVEEQKTELLTQSIASKKWANSTQRSLLICVRSTRLNINPPTVNATANGAR